MKSEEQQGQEVGRCGDKRDSNRDKTVELSTMTKEKRERLLFVPCEAEIMRS